MDAGSKTGLLWLTGYIIINMSVTVLNKALFATYGWPYPSSLALWHYTVTSAGTIGIVRVFRFVPAASLSWGSVGKLAAFSVLFNVNIWLSNVTLNLVSMAMHQVVRALIPGCTVVLSFFILGKRYNNQILLSVAVIIAGVITYAAKGEVDYSYYGLVMTMAGCICAAAKGVVTNLLLVGSLKLHPMDLLSYTSTFSAIQLLGVLCYTGELKESIGALNGMEDSAAEFGANIPLTDPAPMTVDQLQNSVMLPRLLIINGLGAFALNVFSFNANKATSPLAMNIGGIVKQIFSIVLALVIFATPVTGMTIAGIMVTVIGIMMYASESYKEKQRSQSRSQVQTGEEPSKA